MRSPLRLLSSPSVHLPSKLLLATVRQCSTVTYCLEETTVHESQAERDQESAGLPKGLCLSCPESYYNNLIHTYIMQNNTVSYIITLHMITYEYKNLVCHYTVTNADNVESLSCRLSPSYCRIHSTVPLSSLPCEIMPGRNKLAEK